MASNMPNEPNNTNNHGGMWDALRSAVEFDFELEHVMQHKPVKTGIETLDNTLGGGIPVGTYTVVAGEGGAGKSALACLVGFNACMSGYSPLFFSFEMPMFMVASRMLSVYVNTTRKEEIERGVKEEYLTKVLSWSHTQAKDEIFDEDEARAYIAEHAADDVVLREWRDFRRHWDKMVVLDRMPADENGRPIAEFDIESACNIVEAVSREGVRVFPIIDYLQLAAGGAGDEYQRVTAASHRLQRCFKQAQVPGLVISSLRNIGREERKEAPNLSQLRGSGHIGYDAGTVIVLRRDGEWDKAASEQPIEAYVVKNRVGPSGTSCKLMFNGGLNMFR